MAKTIEAYKLRTEIAVDAGKGRRELQATEKDVDKVGQRFNKLGPEIDKALKGKDVGTKFGKDFSSSATALITGDMSSLGQTLGSILGTAIAPGIGTAIGSTVGSAADLALSKISGPIMQTIAAGIELNKTLEDTRFEFKRFAGSEEEANKYLSDLLDLSKQTGILPQNLIEASESLYDFTGNLKLTNTLMRASIDQAADIGGGPEKIREVADALGLIAEKGDLTALSLKKLYKLKINAPELLSQATGLSPEKLKKLMEAGRLRGDVAARLIAEQIEREKGGFAASRAAATTRGQENIFKSRSTILGAEGTRNITDAQRQIYTEANALLASPQAEKLVQFLDQTAGSLFDLVKRGITAGVNVTKGLADGITSSDGLKAVGSAVTSLGNYAEDTLKSFFEIESPSKRMAREIGVPLGQGIADGLTEGFVANFKGQTSDQIVATLEGLLQDPRVSAFFEAIRIAEHGAPNRIVGGRTVSDLSRHPNIVGVRTKEGPSTAFGSYQITGSNWYGRGGRAGLQQRLNLPDASAHSQQLAAAMLFAERDGGAGIRALLAGDIDKAMSVAAKDWTSTPGSKIGGGGQLPRQKWLSNFNHALSVGGNDISDSNPMPVRFVGAIGGASGSLPFDSARDPLGGASQMFGQQNKNLKDYTLVLGEADGAIVNIKADMNALITDTLQPGSRAFRELVNSSSIVPHALLPLIGAERTHAESAMALTKEYQAAAREQLVKGVGILNQLSGAIGQISGLLPQQTVGKKRGFFSKLLGFAAPFLSFIPGVGPILSTIAGIAGNAAGGNWSSAASGISGGFSSGGVFRSSGRGGGGSGDGGKADSGSHRALGGPGFRGRMYWTGEHGPEPFLAPDNGQFLSHRDAMSAMSGGGDTGMAAVLERLHGVLDRLEGMRPDDVVRLGARGYIKAMDQDAGLVRAHGQRLRLP